MANASAVDVSLSTWNARSKLGGWPPRSYRNNGSCCQKVSSGFGFKGRLDLTLTLILGFRTGGVTSRASVSA